jgi:hypothetical protein
VLLRSRIRGQISAGAKADGAPQDNLPRSGSGVAGVADLRIQAAYDALLGSKARKPAGETQTAKTKRAAPKAKPLPKKLRNPKNHPDLIADDVHVKTTQKQPEAAQRDMIAPRRKSAPNASVTPRTSLFRGCSL